MLSDLMTSFLAILTVILNTVIKVTATFFNSEDGGKTVCVIGQSRNLSIVSRLLLLCGSWADKTSGITRRRLASDKRTLRRLLTNAIGLACRRHRGVPRHSGRPQNLLACGTLTLCSSRFCHVLCYLSQNVISTSSTLVCRPGRHHACKIPPP